MQCGGSSCVCMSLCVVCGVGTAARADYLCFQQDKSGHEWKLWHMRCYNAIHGTAAVHAAVYAACAERRLAVYAACAERRLPPPPA